MEKFDARNKIARANEQEYAHQYTPKTREDQYQYANEADRVTYHAHDIDDEKTTEELYSIQPEQTVEPINVSNNRIKARIDARTITEDHRQRSYKIKNQPPVYSKTDIDIDNMQNQNDPRADEVAKLRETSKAFAEQIETEHSKDITNPNERYADDSQQPEADCDCFNVGDKVAHIEEGINGTIKFTNGKRLAVVWEDQTRERFSLAEARNYLKVTQAYVDSVQEQVDPVNTPDSDFQKNPELNSKIDNALSSMENEEDTIEASIDIEKIKLKRRVNELEHQVNEIDIAKFKTKDANEVISLMQKKGLLSTVEAEVKEQFDTIMAMDEVAFRAFKNVIVSTKKASTEEDEIYSILGEDDNFDDIEDGAEIAKQREAMKKSTAPSRTVDGIEMGDTSFFESGGLANFKGTVGDFSGAAATMGSSSHQETRSLAASQKQRKPIERKASGLDMSGFQNIQGPKAPINIPSNDVSVKGKFADLFDSIGWSGMPKK